VLTSDTITETDILDGRWDNATVEIWRVNWADTTGRALMRRGAIGQVRRGRLHFVAEMRSLAHVLGQTIGRTFQASCDAALGDARCGVDLNDPAFKATGTVVSLPGDRAFSVSGISGFAESWFALGTLSWLAGANTGRKAEVLSHAVESLVKAVTLTPGSGEFVYATEPIRRGTAGATAPENIHARAEATDMAISLDRLETAQPNVESVSLVASWFGTDLNAGNCQIKPGVENATKIASPRSWSVNGVSRASAYVVSQDGEGRPAYGGTPADFAIVQAIKELKARGLRVTFYPFLLMDIPAGNTLPDPYSDNAAAAGQPNYPWRGRITCSPAAGFSGAVDKTTLAATQVAAFFGSAQASDFSITDEDVS